MIIQKIKKNKKVIIICVIFILLFLITILLIKINKIKNQKQFLQQEQERVKQYTALTDFKTIQEVALYLQCTLKKQEQSKHENIKFDIYMELPVNLQENGTSNKGFYEKLIQYCAYVLNYKNFAIIDEKNDVNILVYCNEETSQVASYYINGIQNYFDYVENKNNINNFETTESIKVDVTSEELKNIINNNWKTDNLVFGTIETTYKNYDIYFDEGIQIRKVNGKVFNIVFTNNYKNNVIDTINTKSSNEEIEEILGKPQFKTGKLVGYKCENMYVFFFNNQISIYRTDKYNTEKIAEIIQKYISGEDMKTFIDSIKNEWKDYDEYEYTTEHVILKYTLKGMCIKYDSTTKKGVTFYNNYTGLAYGNTTFEEFINNEAELPNNIYIENKNLVFQEEINRINRLDDTTTNNNYKTSATLNTSKEFKIYAKKTKGSNTYKISFISIGNKYPSTELKEKINNGIWLDDYNFIYSEEKRGIYMYNAKDRTYKTLLTGNEKYNIKKIEDNTLYYDETFVTLSL